MTSNVILVLGSEGFIGRHIVEYFLTEGWSVHGCDLYEAPTQLYLYTKVSRLSPELEDVFKKHNYAVCINAAGSGNVNYSMTHPLSDFEANVLDTMRVLDSIRRSQPDCKYVHFSSAAVYGNPIDLPIEERNPILPLSPYGWHKAISETLCREFSEIYNIKALAVRPFSVYGPGLQKQLLWDLYSKSINAKNNTVELWGTGNESRDFIYIKDLVRCIHLLAISGEFSGNVYNLASGKETTIKEVATLFLGKLNPEQKIVFNNQVREGDPLNWQADISKIEKFNFRPQYSLEDGLESVVKWMHGLK